MKASELRIGNWVIKSLTDERCQIYPLGIVGEFQHEAAGSYGDYRPIPLTPEWLERFGFNKHDCLQSDVMWRHPHDKKSVEKVLHCLNFYWQDKAFIFIEIVNDHGEYGTYPIGHIKYVHQLQNLYFALTGKELTIKEPVEK